MTHLTQLTSKNIILHSRPLTFALISLLIAFQTTVVNAQWSAPDGAGNIHKTNTGNVGIGASNPDRLFTVEGVAPLSVIRTTGSNHAMGLSLDAIGTGNNNLGFARNGVTKSSFAWDNSRQFLGFANFVYSPMDFSMRINSDGSFTYHDGASSAERFRINANGNVGIGAANPGYKLDVAGVISSSTGGFRFPDGTVQLTATSAGGGGTITGVTASTGLSGGGTSGAVTLTNNDKGSDQFIFKNVANVAGATQFSAASNNDAVRFAGTGGTTVSFDTGTKKITVDSSGITSSQWTTSGSNVNYAPAGNVGIGTGNPIEKLHVTGNGKITGNLTVDGHINAKYQDVAEWVPATNSLPVATVVTLDPTRSNHVEASSKAYDTRVAGVISEQPGITLGERGDHKVLVATTGRVRLKVDASSGPIQVGDLLVTSDIPGMAMKSQPVNLGGIQLHRPGTLIGKALEPLTKGRGEILVLLSLQ
jgi:hypothetical protein